MIPVNKIAQGLDTSPDKDEKPDFIAILKQRGKFRTYIDSLEEANKRERQNYADILDEYRRRYYKDEVWTAALKKLIVYKHPHMTSASLLRHIDTS